jgi:DNA-binding PadR family transcriptional regulator
MLPTLTALQFFVLNKLFAGETSGYELREALAKEGVKQSGPAFYQMMARLEDAQFVEGWYDERVIDGQMIRERRYRLTGQGQRVHRETLEFYARQGQLAVNGGPTYV